MSSPWNDNINHLDELLRNLSVTDPSGCLLDPDKAFTDLRDLTLQIRQSGNTIFFIGNGASATMASHVAADLEKNFQVRSEVFTDLSRITAIANDMGYNEVFAEPIRRKLAKGDALVAISSSGCSPNILKAVQETAQRGGYIITLSAMKENNPLRSCGTTNFYIPAKSYGLAETCHAAILHYWIDLMTGHISCRHD